jgi:purine-nucleoside phosphorylase
MIEQSGFSRAAAKLQAVFGPPPDGALLLGSGGGPLVSRWRAASASTTYAELGLPMPGVPGHAGTAQLMEASGRRLLVLSGRVHGYEGHDSETQLRLIRALGAWGVPRVILMSAVGGLRMDLPPGSLVRITDHINFAGNPLVGNPGAGPRFPDLTHAYSAELGALFTESAAAAGVPVHEGIYAMMSGPSYETPAEIRMLRQLGGDVVGMSMALEVIGAAEAGMEILGVSVVSNFGSGLSPDALTHEEVLEVVGSALSSLGTVLEGVLSRW